MTKFWVERRHNVEVVALFEITTKEIWQKKKAHETETKWQKLLGVKLPTCSKIGVYSSFRKVADVHYTTLFNFWKAYRTQKKWDTAEEPFGSSKVTSKFRSTIENCWRAPKAACTARNDTKNLDTAKAPKSLCQVANVTVTFAVKENADCTTRLSIHLFLFFDSYASCMQQVCFFGEIFSVAWIGDHL